MAKPNARAPAAVEAERPVRAHGAADVDPPDRVPAAGSQPRAGADQTGGVAGADDAAIAARKASWDFLPDPEVGARIFLAGLLGLVLSIGGLVAVAIRRRQW